MGIVEAASLRDGASILDALADVVRRHAVVLFAQLAMRRRGYFDMQVDAVEQGSAGLAEISLDDRRRSAAFVRGIAQGSVQR